MSKLKKVVGFLGDSYLARLDKLSLQPIFNLDYTIINAAFAGTDSVYTLTSLDYISLKSLDCIVLSTGMNDAAPWKLVPLETTKHNILSILQRVTARRIVLVLPPPLDESCLSGDTRERTNEVLRPYCEMIRMICQEQKLDYIDLWGWDSKEIRKYHAEDGVHLTKEASQTYIVGSLARILRKID